MIKLFLQFVLMLLAGIAILMSMALGLGAGLHYLVPSIDFGIASLLGLLSLLGVFFLLTTVLKAGPPIVIDDVDDEEEDDEIEEENINQMVERVLDRLPAARRRRR